MIDDENASSQSVRTLVAHALRSFPTRALLPILDDGNPLVRTAAARELQIRGERDALDHVLERVGDACADSREIAAFTLGQFGTPHYRYRDELVPALNALALDPAVDVRAAAIAGLGHLRAVESLSTIISASTDQSADVRASVAAALGTMGSSPVVVQALIALLEDDDESVRSWATLSRELLLEEAESETSRDENRE